MDGRDAARGGPRAFEAADYDELVDSPILFGDLRPGSIVVVDVEGEGAERTFSFRGEDKAVVPPIDAIVEAVGAGGAEAGEPETSGDAGTGAGTA